MATQNCCNNTIGSYTIGSTLTVSTGNANITAGNLLLPTTSASAGRILWTNTNTTKLNTFGTRNIWGGPNVGSTSATGSNIPDNAMFSGCTTGGIGAGSNVTNASRNSAISTQGTFRALTTGDDNTACGLAMDTASEASQSFCTAITVSGLRGQADYCTGIGYTSGITGGDSASNIFITHPGVASQVGHASYIGNYGTTGTSTANVNKMVIAGIANATVTGSAVFVKATSQYQVALLASTRRLKDNIDDMGEQSCDLSKLRPVTFNYKTDESKARHGGLIAEEVLPFIPELVEYNDKGETKSVAYSMLPSMLLNELQKQAHRLSLLMDRAQTLQRSI